MSAVHEIFLQEWDPPQDLTGRVTKPEFYCLASYGDLYTCQYDSKFGVKEVAVKVFRGTTAGGDKADKDKFMKIIRRETGIWQRLSHPNITPFLGVVSELMDGYNLVWVPGLVYSWPSNGYLSWFLKNHDGSLAMDQRLQMLLDVANGLQYLHSLGIVHGNFNPYIILIDENYRATLSDFTHASLVGEVPETLAHLKRSDIGSGDEHYAWLAPEYFDEEHQLTTKSDIYSFGHITLQVLSGKPPWTEVPDYYMIVSRVLQGRKPARPRSRPIPDNLWEVILRCWSPIDQRPQAEYLVDYIHQCLRSYLRSEPLSQSHVITPHRTHSSPVLNPLIISDGSSVTRLAGTDSWCDENYIYSDVLSDFTGKVVPEGKHLTTGGGHGDIYRGTGLMASGGTWTVAIKTIRIFLADDGDLQKKLERHRRELFVWLKLQHPNILPLFGTAMDFGQFPAIICPWAENGTLSSYLERCGDRLYMEERLTLLKGVASGLEYLHSQSVVHGDLSGANVLVRRDGGPYIADFGQSMLLNELGGGTYCEVGGTVRWAAPELLAIGTSGVEQEATAECSPNEQSDVYSFGCIMLQTLTGNIPYHYYYSEAYVICDLSRGITPRQPSDTVITDRQWMFIQRCWLPADAAALRPSSKEAAVFIDNELAERHCV